MYNFLSCAIREEIKIKAEHSSDDGVVKDILEPVTQESGANIGKVVVSSSANMKPSA